MKLVRWIRGHGMEIAVGWFAAMAVLFFVLTGLENRP